jgi:hypothetical protein
MGQQSITSLLQGADKQPERRNAGSEAATRNNLTRSQRRSLDLIIREHMVRSIVMPNVLSAASTDAAC